MSSNCRICWNNVPGGCAICKEMMAHGTSDPITGVGAIVAGDDEQQKLSAQLVAEYGETIVTQAASLSGLSLCIAALATDELSKEERATAYQRASQHLAELLETMLTPRLSAEVAACAKRMDEVSALWMADAIEAREGLPPACN